MVQMIFPGFDVIAQSGAPVVAGGWTTARQGLDLRSGQWRDLPPGRITAPRPDVAGLSMDRPRIMGILNVTPDSFSDGGQFDSADAAVAQARAMIAAGADILDIGGESTRPGATPVAPLAEAARVVPVIAALREGGIKTPISVDTRNAATARAALGAGANVVNDISALRHDPEMAEVVAEARCAVCLMHSVGTPQTMQAEARYCDVVSEVMDHLAERVEAAETAGIRRGQIVLDPGIGFGKTATHNLALLHRIGVFHGFGAPVLLGASRKRFIGTLGGAHGDAQAPSARMPGSVAVALAAVAQGVQILRVHDVAETVQAVRLWQAVCAGRQPDQDTGQEAS